MPANGGCRRGAGAIIAKVRRGSRERRFCRGATVRPRGPGGGPGSAALGPHARLPAPGKGGSGWAACQLRPEVRREDPRGVTRGNSPGRRGHRVLRPKGQPGAPGHPRGVDFPAPGPRGSWEGDAPLGKDTRGPGGVLGQREGPVTSWDGGGVRGGGPLGGNLWGTSPPPPPSQRASPGWPSAPSGSGGSARARGPWWECGGPGRTAP